MLKSMTAYGRASLVTPLGRFTAELQSVNRKYLEINANLPKEFLRFEIDIKKWIAAAVARGQVTIRVSAVLDKTPPLVARPNLPLARQIKDAWDKIAQELNIPPGSGFTLEMLANQEDIILFDENTQDEDKFRNALQETIEKALEKLLEMKIQEGNALQQDILLRLSIIRSGVEKIALKAPLATKRFREKLIERLEEVLAGSVENEEKVLREVSVYAEKIDITEELVRLDSHLKQFAEKINTAQDSIGKTLEFLLQEMNREVTTIGSKSSELEVSQVVVELKSELERIREQIQNVE